MVLAHSLKKWVVIATGHKPITTEYNGVIRIFALDPMI